MSGSGVGNKKKSAKMQGWEEAGAEFYQESYPTTEADFEVLQQNPKHLATLLPSKQSRAAATIRIRNNTDTRTMRRQNTTRSRRESTFRRPSTTADVQVAMMPDLSQNLSNEQTTWEEIMEIKAMPVSMAQKKEMKSRLQNEPNLRLQGYEQFKWRRRKFWDRFRSGAREAYAKLELWRSTMKVIEGNHGTGVVSYFLFIKWLMLLDLFIFGTIFLFVMLPTILLEPEHPTQCDANGQDSLCCAAEYFNQTQATNGNDVLDTFQGTGFMEITHLFYGYYTNDILPYNVTGTTFYYNLPLAYVFVTVIYFVVSLVAIVRAASHGFRERLVAGEGQHYQYCNLVFGGWDFCTNNERSAARKHEALYRELRNCLQAERAAEERRNRTRAERNRLIVVRCLINVVVLVVLAACATAIYFAFDFSTDTLTKDPPDNEVVKLLLEFLPSLTIVLFNLAVPILFNILVNSERYSPEFVVRISLIRTIFLRLSSLVVLLASLYSKMECYNNDTACAVGDCQAPDCWETYVGQQFYKLALTDFATHLLLTFFVNFPRSRIAKLSAENSRIVKILCEQTFELPRHVLDVIYLQTVCWLGAFFTPMLPLIAVLITFCMFYVKKFACLVNSVPSATVYRASRSKSLFMLVLLVSFLFAILPVSYAIGQLFPSRVCGPFRDRDTVWSVVEVAFKSTPGWIQDVVFFLPTPGFAVPAFVLLLLALYYYTAVTTANRHMVEVLRNQLVLEGHDKQFLLDKLSLFIKQRHHQQRRETDSGSAGYMDHHQYQHQHESGDRTSASH